MSTIVLIHGLWMTPLSWQFWKERFESQGRNVLAPGWPGVDDRNLEEIRQDPSALEDLGIGEIADHYDAIVRGLDEPPIIMGHSFGGLVTQILLDRGLGSAGVGVAASPFRGILGLPYSTVRVAVAGGLKNPLGKRKTVMLTPKQFNYAFTNTIDGPDATKVYERLPIPGPARTLFQAAFANVNPRSVTKVNFKNDHRAPLLLIAPGKDQTFRRQPRGQPSSTRASPVQRPTSKNTRAAAITSSGNRAGRRSPTMPSRGRSRTPSQSPGPRRPFSRGGASSYEGTPA
jgi:pimeloyl-ACP methyl ester carboxylesterase